MWHGWPGVFTIGKVGALYASAATLPQAASPLQAGTNPWMWLPMQRMWRKTPPPWWGHVALVALVLVFSVLVRNLLRLFTWTSCSGAETHSNASGNWSCADVYSAARTNSSVTWLCKNSHSNVSSDSWCQLHSVGIWKFKIITIFHLADIGSKATFSTWAARGCYQGASQWTWQGGWDAWDVSPLDRFQWVERWAQAHYMHRCHRFLAGKSCETLIDKVLL